MKNQRLAGLEWCKLCTLVQCLANNLMMAGSVRGRRGAGLRPAMPPFLAASYNSLAVNLLENKLA